MVTKNLLAKGNWIHVSGKLSILRVFHLLPLMMYVRKVVGGFGKKICVCVNTGMRKPHRCVTDCHDMILAVKIAVNSNSKRQAKQKSNEKMPS